MAWIKNSLFTVALAVIVGYHPSHQARFCDKTSLRFEVWKGNCYYFTSTRSNFATAKKACENAGTTLVSINSQAEQNFVYTRMQSRAYNGFWIGMVKDNTELQPLEKNYYWLDKSEKVYTNWAPGEPNNHGGVEDCTEMYTPNHGYRKMWNDARCTNYKYGYVCKTAMVEGWLGYNGNEYFISYLAEQTKKTWYEAGDWCRNNGGDLVSLLNAEEKTAVASWAKKNEFVGDLWIGLNKLDGRRENWGWSDGKDLSYKNWKTNYPTDEKYGHLCGYQQSSDTTGGWKNDHCDAKKGFICKRQITSNPTTKITPPPVTGGGYCPSGYTGVGNKCFMVMIPPVSGAGTLTFDQALAKCRQQGGLLPDLASITSELEQAFVQSHLQKLRFGVWIGLRRPSVGADWTWTDSSPRRYSNWAPGQPKEPDAHCAEMWMIVGQVGQWNNLKCSSKRGYVCQVLKDPQNEIRTTAKQTDGVTSCLPGFQPYWDGCYRYESSPLSYEKAIEACQEKDARGQLVGIHAEAENSFVQAAALKYNTTLWIGLNDGSYDSELEGGRDYRWADGWWIWFTNWAEGQPFREQGGGCVKMKQDGTWADDLCSKQMPSICKVTDNPPLTTPAPKEGSCPTPKGWLTRGRYCYLFETRYTNNFQNARKECQKLGFRSNLASVHTAEENRWILDQMTNMGKGRTSLWLGLYRSVKDKSFHWTDGTALQYQAWAPGEPNGEDNNENCVEQYNQYWPGQWNDHFCSHYKAYVCKAPKADHITWPSFTPHCEDGWHYYPINKRCYLFRPDEIISFNIAMEACRLEGAELTSIHEIVENEFINVEMKARSTLPEHRDYWIGMKSPDTAKGVESYSWLDKSEIEFEHWAATERYPYPCVSQDYESGRWTTKPCDNTFGYVCKKQAIEPPEGGLSGGQVAGIVIGVLLAVSLLVLAGFFLVRTQVVPNPLTNVTLPSFPRGSPGNKGLVDSQISYEKTP